MIRSAFSGVLFAAFFSILPAYAAQNALVIDPNAKIHAHPSNESSILETLRKGDRLRISSERKNGWYRVKTLKSDALGWIEARFLEESYAYQEQKNAGITFNTVDDRVRHDGALYLAAFFRASMPSEGLENGFGGRIGYCLVPVWQIWAEFSARQGENGESGSTLTGGLEYAFIHELPWKALAGLQAGTTQLGESSSPVFGFRLAASRRILRATSLLLEGGYLHAINSENSNLSAPWASFALVFEI